MVQSGMWWSHILRYFGTPQHTSRWHLPAGGLWVVMQSVVCFTRDAGSFFGLIQAKGDD